MTRTWPVPRLPGTYTRKPTFLQRQQAALHRSTRLRLQAGRDAALAELAGIDRQLDGLSMRRIALLDELEATRDRLWPAVPICKGRRPPTLDASPMPPVPADARWARGRGLRGLCLTILGRHGALRLEDLHALIHRYGYGIDSPHPVKALADAMGYEVREGRAVRVARGVYDLVDDGRASGFRHGCDPRKGSTLGPLLPWSEGPARDGVESEDVDWTEVDWTGVPADPEERTDPARWLPDQWPDADPDDESCGRDTGPLPPRDPALVGHPPEAAPPAAPGPGASPHPHPHPPPTFPASGTDSVQIRSQTSAEGGGGVQGDGRAGAEAGEGGPAP